MSDENQNQNTNTNTVQPEPTPSQPSNPQTPLPSQPQTPPQQTTPVQQSNNGNVWKWLLIGCLIIFVITLLAAGGCVYFAYRTGKNISNEIQENVKKEAEKVDVQQKFDELGEKAIQNIEEDQNELNNLNSNNNSHLEKKNAKQ